MNYQRIILIFSSTFIFSCKEKVNEADIYSIGTVPCLVKPVYLSKTNLNPRSAILSTSEKKIMGLVLVEYSQNGNSLTRGNTWQHPTWSQHGWLGPITTDEKGNSYTVAVPLINVLDNPASEKNTIYKIDSYTAEMKPLISLPFINTDTTTNPYGLLGLYFDCHGKILYASTVAGSDKDHERGIVYAVDPEKGTIIDKLEGHDVIGLCMGGVTGEKRLYMGSSRDSYIYSVGIDSKGKFSGNTRQELSLDMEGPRGDDKARRIRIDNSGKLQVFGIEFNYNLTAASEKQETVYYFTYDKETKRWGFVNR
ncbi:MAG: hypothetical protein ABIR18_05615 [Chitinophagaceae bacterium]